MNNPTQPNVKLSNDANYRENYANSVQMRVNIWDFFLVFGTLQQQTETQVDIRNFQGIYLSPQQAKALLGLLQQNVAGYESALGRSSWIRGWGLRGPYTERRSQFHAFRGGKGFHHRGHRGAQRNAFEH